MQDALRSDEEVRARSVVCLDLERRPIDVYRKATRRRDPSSRQEEYQALHGEIPPESRTVGAYILVPAEAALVPCLGLIHKLLWIVGPAIFVSLIASRSIVMCVHASMHA